MSKRFRASFEIEVFGQKRFSTKRLEAFLALYVQNYAPFHRTSTNELIYYLKNPTKGREIRYFGLSHDGEPCGFASLMYYPERHLGIFDFIVISPNRRGYGAFFAFTNLIADFLESSEFKLDYVACEVTLKDMPISRNLRPLTLIKLLRLIGFKRARIDYCAPDPSISKSAEDCAACLMVVTFPERTSMASSEFTDVVNCIFEQHYLDWYKATMSDPEFAKYEKSVQNALAEIKRDASIIKDIPLNGITGLEAELNTKPDIAQGAYATYGVLGTSLTLAIGAIQFPEVTFYAIAAILILLLLLLISKTKRSRLFFDSMKNYVVGKFG